MEINIPMNVKVKMNKKPLPKIKAGATSLSSKNTPTYLMLFYASMRFFFLGIKELIAKA